MTRQNKSEKRKYPRMQQRLPVKIAANGYDFITTTENVSCIGAYCRVNKYIPPFTKVIVKLALPMASNDRNENSAVECKGVVVRTEDRSKNDFNIAIFFNEINASQRKKISHYITGVAP